MHRFAKDTDDYALLVHRAIRFFQSFWVARAALHRHLLIDLTVWIRIWLECKELVCQLVFYLSLTALVGPFRIFFSLDKQGLLFSLFFSFFSMSNRWCQNGVSFGRSNRVIFLCWDWLDEKANILTNSRLLWQPIISLFIEDNATLFSADRCLWVPWSHEVGQILRVFKCFLLVQWGNL